MTATKGPAGAPGTHEARTTCTALERLSVLAVGTSFRLEVTRSLRPLARLVIHHSARYAANLGTGAREYSPRTLDRASPAQTRSVRGSEPEPQRVAGALGMAIAAQRCTRWEADIAWALATDTDELCERILRGHDTYPAEHRGGLDLALRGLMRVRLKAAHHAGWQSALDRVYIGAQRGAAGRKDMTWLCDGLPLPPRFGARTVATGVWLLLAAADHAAGAALGALR